jgi:hypothetical protein
MTGVPSRLEYEAHVIALRDRAEAMRRDSAAPEAIARTLHAERRRLSQKFKQHTPEPLRAHIRERTVAVYGDPLGPSVEHLQAKGKSWNDIIESASRPGRLPVNEPLSVRDVEV